MTKAYFRWIPFDSVLSYNGPPTKIKVVQAAGTPCKAIVPGPAQRRAMAMGLSLNPKP